MNSKMFKEYIWEWQYRDNREYSNFDPVVLADKWGTIVGFNGYMPVEIKFDDDRLTGIWSCDFYVDERYRSQGMGTRIKRILNNKFPIILALGISDAASHVHKKAGWLANQEVEVFRKISRPNSIKSLKHRHRAGTSGSTTRICHPSTDNTAGFGETGCPVCRCATWI